MPCTRHDFARARSHTTSAADPDRVVEEYVATGQPVGSKNLVERAGPARLVRRPSATSSPSSSALGLLTHPHTSAGRVPTDRGYRYYADRLLERQEPRPASFPLDLTDARSEVESALQSTTEMLSQVTRLIALVSAPPIQTATVRHVEVLLLQPQIVMVVVITSTGGVTKRVYAFDARSIPGSRMGGRVPERAACRAALGTRALRRRLRRSGPRPERAFLEVLAPAFTERRGGAARLRRRRRRACSTTSARGDGLVPRAARAARAAAPLLDLLADALDPRQPFVRVGDELGNPALHDVSLVGATYGIANRTLGAVSLFGPLRMDYEKAIRSVRSAARALPLL